MTAANRKSRQNLQPLEVGPFNGVVTAIDPAHHTEPGNLVALDNGYCDSLGQIIRMPTASAVVGPPGDCVHVRWSSLDTYIAVENRGGSFRYISGKGHSLIDVAPLEGHVSSVVYDDTTYIARPGQPLLKFDGRAFRVSESKLIGAAFSTVVANRLVLAGFPHDRQTVHLSWADRPEVFYPDQKLDEQAVTRAGFLDIGRQLAEAEEIQGIAAFEQDILLVFTQDRILAWRISQDIEQWQQERLGGAFLNVGAVSHNAVAKANGDLLFVSRSGVHSLRREQQNGIVLKTIPLEMPVQYEFRKGISELKDPQRLTSFYDRDYHLLRIMHPEQDSQWVLHFRASDETPQWSRTDALGETCGDFINGRTVLGTRRGLVQLDSLYEKVDSSLDTPLRFQTAILWAGSPVLTKALVALQLRYDGGAQVSVEVLSERGRVLWSKQHTASEEFLEAPPSNLINGVAEYQVKVKARGFMIRVEATGKGLFRFHGMTLWVE